MLNKIIKVLLIENNRFDACIVQEMLTQEKNIKFKLKIVNYLSKGLMLLAKGKIDVVLLDFTLQKNKGISALSKIHTQAPQVAIVLQTILANKSTAVKTLQKGAQDYLIKDSFNSELLVRSLSYSVEKKNIENMLRESEEKFKKLEESANKPIILIGLKGNLLLLNNCAASDLGGKPKDYISKTLWDIFPKKVADERFKDHQKVIQSGRSNVKEITVSFKGIEYSYLARIQPIRNKSGDVNSVLILDNDITDRKKTEKALAESEERYRILFENTGTATIISEEDRTISMVNNQVEKLSGYSKEEIENKMKWTDFIIPEDLKRMKKYHIARRKAGERPPTEYEFRMTDKKGNVKDIFSKIRMIPDTKKSIASFMDITERKKAEEEIKEKSIELEKQFKKSEEQRIATLSVLSDLNETTKELHLEINERKQAEERIKHLSLILRAIRDVNQLIVREKNREILLQKTCDILTGVRNYNTAWIGLLKDEKTFAIVVGSPLNADVSHFCEQVLRGDHLPCVKKALTKKDPFLFIDSSRDCGDCSLKKLHLGRNSLLVRITHKSKLFGFLVLSLKPDVYIDKEEKELLKEVTDDIAFGLHNIELGENLDIRTYDLKERVKELSCLYGISNLVEKPGISLETIIKGTVNLLPSAWQYPKITCARIILEAKKYQTENFKETTWKQSSDIIVNKEPIGTVEVYYLEERPQIDEGPFLKEEKSLINIIAERLGETIEKKQGERELQQSYQKIQKILEGTIDTISKMIEAKDPYTVGHQQRVSHLATSIAQELDLSQDKIELVRVASLIHDIGKISLPAEILSKPTKLNSIEFGLIKNHSQIGYNILKSIEFPWPVAQIVLQHHERLNGSGYPHKLKDDKILLEARITGVADVVEAMSSHRPYRPALGVDKALEEISQNRGILYDPKVVDTCLKLFKEKGFKFE